MEDTGSSPTVSIVIPVRNAAGFIGRTMRSVLAQDYDGELELIVADGASTDATRAEATGVTQDDARAVVVDNPRAITAAGLNAAIAASQGEVIVRCDAHATLPPGYVRTAVDVLTTTGADVVGGVQAATGGSYTQRSIAIAMTTPLGTGGALFRVGGEQGPTDTVYLGVFRRSALERVGLFDESMVRNQDYELNYRIGASGGVVYFHPDLSVDYAPRATLRALWTQYREYGEWRRRTQRRHPGSRRWRQMAAPLLVLGLGASLVVALTPARPFAAVVPGAYGAALAATAITEWVSRRDVAALAAPAAIATMHVAWGLGFLSSSGPLPEPQIPRLRSHER